MKQLREQSNTDSARIAELQETLEQERKQNNENFHCWMMPKIK